MICTAARNGAPAVRYRTASESITTASSTAQCTARGDRIIASAAPTETTASIQNTTEVVVAVAVLAASTAGAAASAAVTASPRTRGAGRHRARARTACPRRAGRPRCPRRGPAPSPARRPAAGARDSPPSPRRCRRRWPPAAPLCWPLRRRRPSRPGRARSACPRECPPRRPPPARRRRPSRAGSSPVRSCRAASGAAASPCPVRAGLHAQPAQDAPQVVDLVDGAVPLARGVTIARRVVRALHVDGVGGAGPGAQLAADAFLQPVRPSVQLVAAVEPWRRGLLLLRVLDGVDLPEHLPEGDAEALDGAQELRHR